MEITAAVSRPDAPFPMLETLDLGPCRPDEVLVRMVATGICHTDLGCHSGHGMPVPHPIVLGHEGAGVVEQVGAGVSSLRAGDHVVLSGASCGHCRACLAARPTYCREVMKLSFGGGRADGSSPLSKNGEPVAGAFFAQSSFASHVVVPARSAIRVPADIPLATLAPLGCGIATGVGAVLEALKVRPGDGIAIFGTGSVGLAGVMAAKLAGAFPIVAIDRSADRLALALELGASHAIAAVPDMTAQLAALQPDGFAFSFNTTSAPEVFDAALACLANEGTAGFVARPNGPWVPDMGAMLGGGRRLQGILGGSAAPQLLIPQMIAFWRQGRLPFDRLITEYPFEQIGEAWQAFRSGSVVKPVLRMAEA
jgi:aryl-alcohol dehydrogenase